MTVQEEYDHALTVYESAAAEYQRLNLLAEGSSDAAAAYASAQEAYARLVAAHEALAAGLATQPAAVTPGDGAPNDPAMAHVETVASVEVTAPGVEASTRPESAPTSTRDGFTVSGFDASPLGGAPEIAPFAPDAASLPGGAVLRRGTAVRMVPQQISMEEQVPAILRRNLLHPNAQVRKAEISRNRRIVGNLPEWSPLPPGEIVTRATRRRTS